jgi:phage gp36-like protein
LAYATLQDLITRFSERRLIQLTDRFVPPAEVIDESVTAEAIQHAGDLIDGYVRAIYALPFQTVPALLNGLACDIAYFRLFQEPTDEARKRYDDALRTLRDISAGKIKLPVADGQDAPSRPDVIRATAQPRLFNRDSLRGL